MMVLLDLTRSYESMQRHVENSEKKSVPQLSLEDPIKTAVLLSLVGVRSILANQWPTFLQDNALRASILWESMLTVGRPIGRAVRLLQRMGAGDPGSHGNGCCPPSSWPPPSQRPRGAAGLGCPPFPGHFWGSARAAREHSLPSECWQHRSSGPNTPGVGKVQG
uniref:Uncharacterized protein n=1 Tax=Mustela putorius furo TaxID=9669 RepID=M3Y1G0_MUSPF